MQEQNQINLLFNPSVHSNTVSKATIDQEIHLAKQYRRQYIDTINNHLFNLINPIQSDTMTQNHREGVGRRFGKEE